ncbi:hypothetical protein ABPG75_013156 [Micractinium tetrahymenae]
MPSLPLHAAALVASAVALPIHALRQLHAARCCLLAITFTCCLMANAGPRACVAAPTSLLAFLRCRATRAAQISVSGSTRAERPLLHRGATRQHRWQVAAAPAAAAPSSGCSAAPGLQSSAGVHPDRLVGFRVLDLSHKNEFIGIVNQVLSMAETGQAQPLLHVCTPADPQQPAGAPREEHLIPYVAQIVPSIDTAAALVYIQPPAGLLELGRQHLLMARLERDLEPYTHPPPLSLLSRMGLRTMPTSAQLAAAGRRDLIAAVKRAGGFLEVAQALGLRSQRKPAGYWEDESNLDEELTLFVAAHWTQFTDPESRQPYWYNQITHKVSWEEPLLPQRIDIDEQGGYILTEAEEDRVMPSRSSLFAAGRYDLHHAILLHGGYTTASELLGRQPAWPPYRHLQSLPALRHELKEFIKETGLPFARLPTASQLVDAGRGDLLQAIVHRGGFAATAAALGWGTQRRQRSAWADEHAAAVELRRFIKDTQSGGGGDSGQRRGAAGKPSLQRQRAAAGAQGEEQDDAAPLPSGARMPTHRELMAAGRHDLRYAVQRHGSAKLAALLGIQHDRRGAHNRRQPGGEAPLVAEGLSEPAGGAT